MSVWLKAAVAQTLAWLAISWVFAHSNASLGEIGDSTFAWIVGTFAAAIGWVFRLPGWWIPIQLLFVPSLNFALSLEMPPVVFLAGLILLLLLFPSNMRERVPLYLSNQKTWTRVAELLPGDQPRRMLDLGCGSGGGLVQLSQAFPQDQFVGVETSPLLYAIARLRLMGRPNAQVILRDLWEMNLVEFDLVYAFLSPSPMPRLWEKVRAEMRPGSVFVSNSFEIPDVLPDESVTVEDGRRTRLLVWRL